MSPDPKNIGPIKLMRRLYADLPEGSIYRRRLGIVISGLGTPDHYMSVGNEVVYETRNLETARSTWRELFPQLLKDLPGHPLVHNLLEFYDETGQLRNE